VHFTDRKNKPDGQGNHDAKEEEQGSYPLEYRIRRHDKKNAEVLYLFIPSYTNVSITENEPKG
jgi:hypothetical protein